MLTLKFCISNMNDVNEGALSSFNEKVSETFYGFLFEHTLQVDILTIGDKGEICELRVRFGKILSIK